MNFQQAIEHFSSGVDKQFCLEYNIGHAKYCVSYHNGIDTYPDGSPFYRIAIFKNKVKLNKFIRELTSNGYKEN